MFECPTIITVKPVSQQKKYASAMLVAPEIFLSTFNHSVFALLCLVMLWSALVCLGLPWSTLIYLGLFQITIEWFRTLKTKSGTGMGWVDGSLNASLP